MPLLDATRRRGRRQPATDLAARRSVDRMSHPHPELGPPPALARGRPARRRAGRARRGRPEHDRLRVRRPAAGRRLRRALPGGLPARGRPDPARLRVHPGPAGRRRGRRPDPRPRGPHRRGAVPAAREAGHPADRLAADPGAGRGQAAASTAITPYTLEVAEGERERFGPFDCEFLAVNHSIPDALAVAIRTPAGLVLHTGDFKMDQLPLDGRLTDLRAFARLGDEGVDLLLVDSTNAEVPGLHHPGARHRAGAGPGLRRRPTQAGHRRVASPATCTGCSRCSTPRPSTAARSRSSAGRWCATWAWPATSATSTCPAGLLVDVKALDDLPDDQIVLVCTGSQGEPMSALSRIANRDHAIRVGEGDTVILASSLIPGNENRGLPGDQRPVPLGREGRAQGATPWCTSPATRRPASSSTCYNIVRPRNVMPVHGEWRHLRANADLAVLTGVPARPHRARRGRRRGRPGRRPGQRSSARCRAATSTSTAPASATSPSRR